MKGYEAVARALRAEGCDVVFTLLGDANMLIMAAAAESHGVRLAHARHENTAVSMADGAARLTGRVGVASVTAGPGLTNVATALAVAARHRTPLVVIAGDVPSGANHHGQRFDQRAFVVTTGALSVVAHSPKVLLQSVKSAFYLARSKQLPVVLTIPLDVQNAELGADWSYRESALELAAPGRLEPAPDAVSRIADLLRSARKPVIIAGRGVADAGAQDAVAALGDRIGALLATTLRGKGLFRGDPYDIGIVGSLGSKAARELVAAADCVIGIGASLGFYTTEDGKSLGKATVIQIDNDPPGLHEGRFVADHYLVADARLGAQALHDALAASGTQSAGYRTDAVRSVVAESRQPPSYEAEEIEEGFVHPAQVMRQLNTVLGAHHHVVVGGGGFWTFPGAFLNALGPEGYNFEADFMAIGQAYSMAMGAAVADGHRSVIAIEGDGSAMLNLQELDAVADGGIPVMLIVINDGGYGAEVHGLAGLGMDGSIARFKRADFPALARAFGVEGVRLQSSEQIVDLVREFDRMRKPMVVEVPMSEKVISPRVRRTRYGQNI